MDMFMLYLLLMLPFTVPGDSFITLFGLEGSWQGLEQGHKNHSEGECGGTDVVCHRRQFVQQRTWQCITGSESV